MKIALLVEGDTERKALPVFLKRWLDPQVETAVALKAVSLRGSGSYSREFVPRAHSLLERGFAVVGLIDRYQSGIEFPDRPRIRDWYGRAKTDLESKVDSPLFRQHFAVHETEAWILSDPNILPGRIRGELPKTAAGPEGINLHEPPSKLLNSLYQKRLGQKYKKTNDGVGLFSRLDPQLAASKCPHLQLLLDDLLELARRAG